MLSKKKIINTLFVLSFPWYGYGAYNLAHKGFAIGIFTCAIPFVLILGIYMLDLLYRKSMTPLVNGKFYLVMGALTSLSISVLVGLHNKSPLINNANGALLIVLFYAPFLSSVVVQVYNRADPKFNMAWLVTQGFISYLVFNLMGMALGIKNGLHSFPGRASPPFAFGIYDAAHLLAIFNLILLSYLREFRKDPMRWFALAGLYVISLGIILSINSRLSFMIFIVFTALFISQAMRALRGLFAISLFTMPIMMSFALLIYEILSLPLFAAIMERVDKADVTTFNGRTYIWTSAADWLTDDRRGLIFGNGYNGQYHLRILRWVAKLWGETGDFRLHMHSAFLEILVNQGVVGILLMYGMYWTGYKFYQRQYLSNGSMAPLYAGFVYMMFVWQIDIVAYAFYSGSAFVFILMGPVVMKRRRDEPHGMLTGSLAK
ncbi:MAG: O-antigen ligase family protein [Flavobacteriales bacterium]|nr:O-antigen ligase family protein [Flavobacteriales bacterium]MCB0758439.1 O-antigen ligase family protein [Flavobacteriales bacterium]